MAKLTQLELFAKVHNVKILPEDVQRYCIEKRQSEPVPQLTMLSFGGGQDSFAMLYSIIHDPAFREKYAPNDFFVAMSDTGNEHPATYEAIKFAEKLCAKHNIHFMFVTNDMGFHTPGWMDLKGPLKRNSIVFGSAMQQQSCTINLKITVMDKYLTYYMAKLYGFQPKVDKNNWADFYKKFGPKQCRVLIGFAKDEETRPLKSINANKSYGKWKETNLNYVYPLIEEGWNRLSAQTIILKYRKELMPPSNCMICFYQSPPELVWLERNHPEEFYDWVEMEKAKFKKTNDNIPLIEAEIEVTTDPVEKKKLISKLSGMKKNLGVYEGETLITELAKAKAEFGNWSDERLNDYKMSHGHCVKSGF